MFKISIFGNDEKYQRNFLNNLLKKDWEYSLPILISHNSNEKINTSKIGTYIQLNFSDILIGDKDYSRMVINCYPKNTPHHIYYDSNIIFILVNESEEYEKIVNKIIYENYPLHTIINILYFGKKDRTVFNSKYVGNSGRKLFWHNSIHLSEEELEYILVERILNRYDSFLEDDNSYIMKNLIFLEKKREDKLKSILISNQENILRKIPPSLQKVIDTIDNMEFVYCILENFFSSINKLLFTDTNKIIDNFTKISEIINFEYYNLESRIMKFLPEENYDDYITGEISIYDEYEKRNYKYKFKLSCSFNKFNIVEIYNSEFEKI